MHALTGGVLDTLEFLDLNVLGLQEREYKLYKLRLRKVSCKQENDSWAGILRKPTMPEFRRLYPRGTPQFEP